MPSAADIAASPQGESFPVFRLQLIDIIYINAYKISLILIYF